MKYSAPVRTKQLSKRASVQLNFKYIELIREISVEKILTDDAIHATPNPRYKPVTDIFSFLWKTVLTRALIRGTADGKDWIFEVVPFYRSKAEWYRIAWWDAGLSLWWKFTHQEVITRQTDTLGAMGFFFLRLCRSKSLLSPPKNPLAPRVENIRSVWNKLYPSWRRKFFIFNHGQK